MFYNKSYEAAYMETRNFFSTITALNKLLELISRKS